MRLGPGFFSSASALYLLGGPVGDVCVYTGNGVIIEFFFFGLFIQLGWLLHLLGLWKEYT